MFFNKNNKLQLAQLLYYTITYSYVDSFAEFVD